MNSTELLNEIKNQLELLKHKGYDKNSFKSGYLLGYAKALQLQQTGVKQSVFYSIVDNGTVLEKFKEKETAEYALEEYKRMGFPYATILEIVA